jgi:hypothetical protein
MPEGIALHARSLEFQHPASGEGMKLVAPLPADWAAVGIILPDQVEDAGS